MRRRPTALLSVLTLLSMVALATASACGAKSAEQPRSTAPGQVDEVTVAVIPIVDVAPIYLGVQQGFFANHQIKLNLVSAQGGAVIVPGVLNGQYEFGFSNVVSLLVAQSKGVPIKIVANGNNSTGIDGQDFASVMVRGDSPIKTAADLAGKKVAINTLKNIGDTAVRASVRKAGGDPSKINFVELAFPDMSAAVAAGRVDAAFVVEPFQTAMRKQGMRSIASSYADTAANLTVAAYFTTKELIARNPELVKRFTDAMQESLAYADSHSPEVRKILGTYTQISADAAAELMLPKYPKDPNRLSIQALADLAVTDGLMTSKPDVNALLP